MNKTIIKILILLAALAVLTILAPRFLQLDTLQTEIIANLNSELQVELKAGNIDWHWLPLPHLALAGVQLESRQASLSVPEVSLYPHWQALFGDRTRLGKIHFQQPDIRIKQFASGQTGPVSLPGTKIVIEDGRVTMPVDEVIPDIFKHSELLFTAVQSTIRVKGNGLNINFRSATPFNETLALAGNFNLDTKAYRFAVNAPGLKLHKVINSIIKGRIRPVESEAALTGSIEGTGLAEIKAQLRGQLPGLIIRPADDPLFLDCGRADLTLLKAGPDLVVDIRDLEIKEPALRLKGRLQRNTAGGSKKPSWLIDLAAADLNLTEIRKGILTLWPANRIAETVCGIVRGGRARHATFRFDGPLAGLNDLANMAITADVLSASIHVPVAGLDLTDAQGQISIINGNLAGSGLQATLGKSEGENADLFLDLKHLGRDFKLEIDLDADLAALPPILHRLIKHQGFLDELEKFSKVSGRARGHLSLGDTLDDLTVRIRVDEAQAEAAYERLDHPVTIQGGGLAIHPKTVNWHNLQAVVGPHTIHGFSGTVDWTGPVTLDINNLDASLDSAPLYAELQENSILPRQIAAAVAGMTGRLAIKNTSVRGPLGNPAAWEYGLDLAATGARINSHLTPGPLDIETITATLTQDRADLTACRTSLAGQELTINGELSHTLLENWLGHLELSGTINDELAAWAREKGWLPANLTPQTPSILQGLNITWDTEAIAVNGGITAGLDEETPPTINLEISATPGRLTVGKLEITAGTESGRLTLEQDRTGPPGLHFTWDGALRLETLALFLQSRYRSGLISGSLEGKITDSAETTFFTGQLKASDLVRTWGKDEYAILRELVLLGHGNILEAETLRLDLGQDDIAIQGQAAFALPEIILELTLNSEHLKLQNIEDLDDEFRAMTSESAGWDVIGTINLAVNEFVSSKQFFNDQEKLLPDAEDAEPYLPTWNRLRGLLQIQPAEGFSFTVQEAELCGMAMQGTWNSEEELLQDYRISTMAGQALLFQEVLPCLGKKQDLIKGEFTINADLKRRQGKFVDGQIEIISSQGTIFRLGVLSRIFKVINITDLFTKPDSPDKVPAGFPYSSLTLKTGIQDNTLFLEKMVIKGEGLNLFGRGGINLDTFESDLIILIAPLKTLDAVVTQLPLIGRVIGGENKTLITIPVSVKGNINDPVVTALPPEAIGDAIINLVKGTFTLPIRILTPDKAKKKKTRQ